MLALPGAPTHPPQTMKMSRKKEPTAEAMVSVLQMQAMAWNSEVALPGWERPGEAAVVDCEREARAMIKLRAGSPGTASPAAGCSTADCLAHAAAAHPPGAGEEHEEPEDEEAPGVVKAHRPVDDERPERGVQQRVRQAEEEGRHGKAPALRGVEERRWRGSVRGLPQKSAAGAAPGRVGAARQAAVHDKQGSPGRSASPAASRTPAGAA